MSTKDQILADVNTEEINLTNIFDLNQTKLVENELKQYLNLGSAIVLSSASWQDVTKKLLSSYKSIWLALKNFKAPLLLRKNNEIDGLLASLQTDYTNFKENINSCKAIVENVDSDYFNSFDELNSSNVPSSP